MYRDRNLKNKRYEVKMDKNVIFDKEMLKQIKKTSEAHSVYTEENNKLKKLFKKKIGRNDLEAIMNVVENCGYDDQKDTIKKFKDLVNVGNHDVTSIVLFKDIVDNYTQEIINALENEKNTE